MKRWYDVPPQNGPVASFTELEARESLQASTHTVTVLKPIRKQRKRHVKVGVLPSRGQRGRIC